jgi:DNA-binding beta-propeller fold protein YncE
MRSVLTLVLLAACAFAQNTSNDKTNDKKEIPLPTSKLLLAPVPGGPQQTNSFPTAMVVSPDGKYLAVLNNGYGAVESKGQQSIGILDLKTNELKDFPDPRLGPRAQQTYFLGLAWSANGKHLYASVGSITDPLGEKPGNTGNGIAVYAFENGAVTPERFIKIGLQQLAPGKKSNKIWNKLPEDKAIPYPAGIAVVRVAPGSSPADPENEKLLVADNLSDDALLIEAASGKILHRFDLSTSEHVPAAYPYGVVVGERNRVWVSLWNGSKIAEIDLSCGWLKVCRPVRSIPLHADEAAGASSHPTAMLLSADRSFLYAAMSNSDEVAVIPAGGDRVVRYLSVRLPGQQKGGAFPNALAQTRNALFVANASSDSIAVFPLRSGKRGREVFATTGETPALRGAKATGFIPTEWYPTALAVHDGKLFIASGKGTGSGPNGTEVPKGTPGRRDDTGRPFIASLIHGSIARVNIADALKNLPELTKEVERSNLMAGRTDRIEVGGKSKSPIKHVIYVIKENRTYDQIFGDIAGANGDPSLVMYGEDITPNQHKLARQFGVLDNFYDSGEISGNGHVWSTAAITSDYTEKTWQIGYRGRERTYDYEGVVGNRIPMDDDIPDVNEPGTGYIWTNLARHKRTYRHYGEYVTSRWCNEFPKEQQFPQAGTPLAQGVSCAGTFIRKGEVLPTNVGDPKGGASPYPWPVPILARNDATKPELRGHFDPKYPDFRLDYPDQLRADEFLNEFAGFAKARAEKKDAKYEMPEFIVLRLPNDHTSGTRPGYATPSAAVADNDLAVGRVVDAVTNSPYWDDTAIFVLEDDAQDGADHVDAHRSTALVISKWSPKAHPHVRQSASRLGGTWGTDAAGGGAPSFVDHTFYTTVNLIHTMEVLLGLPPMNNNDARAAVMAALFSGDGTQGAFTADYRNRDNGLIYEMNPEKGQGAKESAAMDFTHADSVDTTVLNAILWRDRKGNAPMPKPVHTMIGSGDR